MSYLLEVIDLEKRLGTQQQVYPIRFGLPAGKRLAIAGATGSGKTTLLKLLAGLAQPTGGQVLFKGDRVPGSEERLLPGHAKIAYLSQHFELRNHYRIRELLQMASKVTDAEHDQIVEGCRIGHLVERKNNELSGGERQRVALARTLLARPELLLLDEPFSNMDAGHTQWLKTVLTDLADALSLTVILVSHDARDSLTWADEMLVLEQGALVQQGHPRQVYFQPVNENVAGLFGAYNLLSPEVLDALGFIRLQPERLRHLLVRPERLRIQQHAPANAQVEQVAFAGPYQEVRLVIAGSPVLVYTDAQDRLSPGQPVHVALPADGHWFL